MGEGIHAHEPGIYIPLCTEINKSPCWLSTSNLQTVELNISLAPCSNFYLSRKVRASTDLNPCVTLHDANLVLSIFFGPFLMDSIMKMHLILIYRHVIFLGGVTTQMFLGWGQPLSAFYLLSIPIQGFIFICFSRKTRTSLIVLIDTVTLYPYYSIYINTVSS